MKTYFYNRSAFKYLPVPLPKCFVDLDDKFDTIFNDFTKALLHPSVRLAENVCRRMADIELFAGVISELEKDKDIWRASITISSYLVAYFGACKSLLDAISITLNTLFNLALPNKEQDFGKGKFWKVLQNRDNAAYSRYIQFQPFYEDIIRWREAAVHRFTPMVVVHTPTDPPNAPREQMVLKTVAHTEPDFGQMIRSPLDVEWSDPLGLHIQWQPKFIMLCCYICDDIASRT